MNRAAESYEQKGCCHLHKPAGEEQLGDLDRMSPLYSKDFRFQDICLLVTAAEQDASPPEGAIQELGGWIGCFERAEMIGTVFRGGVDAPGRSRETAASARRTPWERGSEGRCLSG